MNKTRLAALLASAVLATGCSFIPSINQPEPPVATQYPVVSTIEGPVAADIPWQSFFTDPRLQQLIGLAL